VVRDERVTDPAQRRGLVVGIREDLEGEVSSTSGDAGMSQATAHVVEVLLVHVAAPGVRGDGP